ncbi:MAG: phospholipase D-like domain-containing protein, partial [Elusimicrobiota bacterium]
MDINTRFLGVCLSFMVAASAARAAFTIPGFELVCTLPVDTTLEPKDLRQAHEVWPEMFAGAKKSIDIEQFYVTPKDGEPLDAALAELAKAGERGVKIRFLLEKKFEKNSLEGIERLKKIQNLELRILEWGRMAGEGIIHAKFMVVDGKEAYVGSQNFDWRSLKHIHEMGLKVTEPQVAKDIAAVFDADWAAQ